MFKNYLLVIALINVYAGSIAGSEQNKWHYPKSMARTRIKLAHIGIAIRLPNEGDNEVYKADYPAISVPNTRAPLFCGKNKSGHYFARLEGKVPLNLSYQAEEIVTYVRQQTSAQQ